ncbi:MAG: hypothetical protein MJA27_20185 [Pseudanabaenales cyanobacterium]|nr:hypothetical protein [Pseudanabaenales cyanobacterium]
MRAILLSIKQCRKLSVRLSGWNRGYGRSQGNFPFYLFMEPPTACCRLT